MLMRALSVHIGRDTAGAARIRHSLRPLISRGRKIPAQLGRNASRERRHTFSVIVREGGRSSIPETLMIEPRSRGVLDHPPSRVMTAWYGAAPSTSLRAKRLV